jgi:meso-butanediol dehydrogenase/(S,S)-butanediol dehydrogenase/diacetyl reductase
VSLEGRIAIVTGAGRRQGIGFAIARRLGQDGCRVVLADIGRSTSPRFPAEHVGLREELEGLAADLRGSGVEALAVQCDITSEPEVEALVRAAKDGFGGVDVLVNNAGVGYLMSPLTDLAIEDWDAVLDVNLRGPFLATKHAARVMIDQGRGGRIINIASQAAKTGFAFLAAYTASKHGLVGLTRSCAIELAPHGITVNAVCPNHIGTGLGAWQNDYMSRARGQTLEERRAAILQRIPLGRIGTQDDIAGACAFLVSDAASFITGEALNVSGGEEMH